MDKYKSKEEEERGRRHPYPFEINPGTGDSFTDSSSQYRRRLASWLSVYAEWFTSSNLFLHGQELGLNLPGKVPHCFISTGIDGWIHIHLTTRSLSQLSYFMILGYDWRWRRGRGERWRERERERERILMMSTHIHVQKAICTDLPGTRRAMCTIALAVWPHFG